MEHKIFKSNWTLNYEDDQMDKKYYENKRNKFFRNNAIFTAIIVCFSFISICIYLTRFNLFDHEMQFKLNKFSTIMTFICHLVTLFVALLNKNQMKVQKTINYLNYFTCTFDISFISLILVLTYSESEHNLIDLMMSLLETVLRVGFFLWDMLSFMEGLILHFLIVIVYLAYHLSVTSIKYMYFHIISYLFMTAFLCLFSYIHFKDKKKFFYFYQKSENQNNWHENMFENMNTGLLKVKNSKIIYANKKIIDFFHKFVEKISFDSKLKKNLCRRSDSETNNFCENLKNSSHDDVKKISYFSKISNNLMKTKFEENSDLILYKLLVNNLYLDNQEYIERIENGNPTFDHEEKTKSYLNELANDYKIFSENFKNNNFKSIGIKLFNNTSETNEDNSKEIQLEIFYRYFTNADKSDSFEFIFNDVTRIKFIEEKNAEIKYKSVFFSKIAHEFKNPIITINELLSMSEESLQKFEIKIEELNLNLSTARGLSEYLLILVKDIAFISKYENQENIEIFNEEINVDEIMDFCKNIGLGLLRKSSKQDKIEFETKKNMRPETKIRTDEIKLKQILVNLISNSVKFTQIGRIILSFEEVNSKLEISVEDTGVGIKNQSKEEFLGNFVSSNVKNQNENNKHGKGLGMFIAKNLSERLGSGISFESEENIGTKFKFELEIELRMNDDNIITNTKTESIILKTPSNKIPETDNCIIYIENSKNSESDFSIDDALTIKLENPIYKIILNSENFNYSKTNNPSETLLIDGPNLKRNGYTGVSTIDAVTNENESGFFNFNRKNSIKSLNIIVVDDERLVRQSTIRIVKRIADDLNISVNIIEANDGIETLFKVYKNFQSGIEIHCIISDETMNYMNGSMSAEILKNLFEKVRMRRILFYIVSAYENNFGYSDAIEAFETKPLNSNIVRRILLKCKEFY